MIRPFVSRYRANLRAITTPASAVLIGAIGGNSLRMLSTIILTRILTPDIFGATAILSSVFYTVTMLTDLGFEAYVVRHEKGDDRTFLDAIWTIHALRGFANFLLAVPLAFPVARLLGKPELGPVLAVASSTFAINGAVSFGPFVAVRNSRLARFTIYDLGMAAIQTGLSLILAIATRSIWGLVAAMVITSIIRTVLSYPVFGTPIPTVRVDKKLNQDLWRFSRPIFLSSIITLILAQTDKLILARSFSLTEFGIYGIASTLAAAPQAFAYAYANKVFYAQLSTAERNSPGRASGLFYQRSWAFILYIAGAGFLIGAAPLVINLLYDVRYQGAGRFLSVLSVATLMLSLTQCAANFFVVRGAARHVLRMNISRLLWLLIVAPIAYWKMGTSGIVLTLGLVELPAYAYALWQLNHFATLRVVGEARFWAIAAIGGVAGVIANLIASHSLPHL